MKPPMQYALLVAALMQILPMTVLAADKSDKADKTEKAAKADKEEDSGKACEDCPDYSGWAKWFELGVGSLSDDSYHFGRYTGSQDEGAYINANAEANYRAKSGGGYMNAKVTDLGLDSRRVTVDSGRQGKYGVTVEYDQVPNYRKQYPDVSLKTERDRSGIKFSAVPGRDWEITGFYRHEAKDGTRDVGSVIGVNSPMTLPVAFNYETNDFGLNLGYKGERFQAEIAYAGSLFNNDKAKITWSDSSPGQIAEAPDNQFHQISALMGYQLTDHTRIGAKLAFGRMTQDQDFLSYTVNPSIVTNPLPASSLNGEVKTTLAKLDLTSRPSPRVRLEASYAYSNRDNNTPTNYYDGYVITDAGVSPDARQNRPYSFEQNLFRLKAGYRLPKDADLSGGFDYDKMDRSYQQVSETKDETLWVKLKLHPMDVVDASIKASHANRDASAPEVSTAAAAYQNPSYPESGVVVLSNPLMLAFEYADRTRDKIGVDMSYNPQQKLTLGFALDYYKDDYKHMELGLTKATGLTYTPSITYTFSENLSASLYYSYEKLESDQSGREWITVPAISTRWAESDSNKTETVGLSCNWKAIPNKLNLGADLVYADFTGKIRYAHELIPFPDLTSTLTAIGVHGTYKISDNMSLRAEYRYERYKESDWANVALPFTLGETPQNQETHLIYLAVRYAFK
jgi:MtrB/PioB family decaheme-associated outer membrane protein